MQTVENRRDNHLFVRMIAGVAQIAGHQIFVFSWLIKTTIHIVACCILLPPWWINMNMFNAEHSGYAEVEGSVSDSRGFCR